MAHRAPRDRALRHPRALDALPVLRLGQREAVLPGLVGGVLVSLVAGIIQARRIGVHRYFNHNDVYHVIQVIALFLVYRGGALLVDR